jgi:hypothetical protein
MVNCKQVAGGIIILSSSAEEKTGKCTYRKTCPKYDEAKCRVKRKEVMRRKKPQKKVEVRMEGCHQAF